MRLGEREFAKFIRPLGGAFLALTAFLFLGPPVLAQDGAFESCVRELAERDLAGKTAFQEAVRDLIAAQKPEFEPLASLHMAHQIALAQVRAAQPCLPADARPGTHRYGEPVQVPQFRLVGDR